MQLFGFDIRFQKRPKKHHHGRIKEIDYFAPCSSLFDFAKSEILDCQKMITSRLANMEYHAKIDFLACEDIFRFLDDNRLQYVRRMFFDGYVIVNTECMQFVDTPGRQTYRSWDGKMYFELCTNEVLQASETFEATGYSDYHFLKDKIRFLNIVNSSDMNLIENYGAMGIVSPESDNSVAGAEYSEEDIADLQERYKKSYGITLGKWQLMFTPRPTRYSPITLPIAQLQLADKRLYLLKALYAAFGIPKELSQYFENSRYSNRNEAELEFYSSTIKNWGDALLRLGEKMYNNLLLRHDYLMQNEFWYDFVGVYALQESQLTEKEKAREELVFWREVKTTLPEHAETADARIENLIETL